MGTYDNHKLLIANRGEIAVRILRTAKRIGLPIVTIYTHSDSLSPHVLQADESVVLPLSPDSTNAGSSEAAAYLSIADIIQVCKTRSVTLVHPGYGFLSENADFATQVVENGMIWLGPRPEIIRSMGLKHEARQIAQSAGLNSVPGSDGLVESEQEASEVAARFGFPVLLKATAGGGGMGMVVCRDGESLKKNFQAAKDRAQTLFHNNRVFLERYFDAARHIEVQIFGNGQGNVVHLRERECSAQRRHQKVIEESPSPFCTDHPGLRERMCDVAVALAQSIKYNSAGTIEFLVDEETANFYFLEMNTRIQVEHPVTEQIHPGLDLIELMIKQGLEERSPNNGLPSFSTEMQQATYDMLYAQGVSLGHAHAIEGRIYAENPYEGFIPSPGLIQHVSVDGSAYEWLRVDSWVETGMTITPHFDPLLAKVVVSGASREVTISRFLMAMNEIKISGPPNNIRYLSSIVDDETFRAGAVTTTFLETFKVHPRAFKVLSPGINTTIQDLPGRNMKLGIPTSGPMDNLAFAAANILVGNPRTTEGLEIVVVPGVRLSFRFFTHAVVALTGKEVRVRVSVNGERVAARMWARVVVPPLATVAVEAQAVGAGVGHGTGGFRVYMAIRGGFPDVPVYLGSKSTSMGLGGYQGRSLLKGDLISLGDCAPTPTEEPNTNNIRLPKHLTPRYPSHWTVHVLPGPHGDTDFLTPSGLRAFYSTRWHISPSSNRLGIRLSPPPAAESNISIAEWWARESGGEGGAHPSNILDNGYVLGAVNMNGDTPVVLAQEGPDMGGYLCVCAVVDADMWKLGQLAPGDTLQFRIVSWADAIRRSARLERWLAAVEEFVSASASAASEADAIDDLRLINTETDLEKEEKEEEEKEHPAVLHVMHGEQDDPASLITFRQAGDAAILVEFGHMHLDIVVRARIHAFQGLVGGGGTGSGVRGLRFLCPCIRSIMCHYDPTLMTQRAFLSSLLFCAALLARSLPNTNTTTTTTTTFPARKITLPLVLDDKWSQDAIARYMATTRDSAVYLPSNVEYLARGNGFGFDEVGREEALKRFVDTEWLVLGVGFYLACPFLVPIDPRSRLIAQKMNPSRTYTPRGAIGIAGPVAAIYPIESPGGYQLFGRTLPTWQTWAKGVDFKPERPWLLEAFDQIVFKPVSEEEYVEIEKRFDAGQYVFQIEQTEFSVSAYTQFVESIEEEVRVFRARQAEAAGREAAREQVLLREWEASKVKSGNDADADASRSESLSSSTTDTEYATGQAKRGTLSLTLRSPIHANVWQIRCALGEVVREEEQVLVVLEAMKTEVPVCARVDVEGGDDSNEHAHADVEGGGGEGGARRSVIGMRVARFGEGVREGRAVRPGDVLVVLE